MLKDLLFWPEPISAADTAEYRRAMFLLVGTDAAQYLLAHTRQRMDGAAKAEFHRRMSSYYVATMRGIEPDRAQAFDQQAYDAVHDTTASELTNHLDQIGLTPDSHISEALVEQFFIAFHIAAVRAISQLAAQHEDQGS